MKGWGTETEDYSQYKKELEIPVFTKEDSEAFAQYLKRDANARSVLDKIPFWSDIWLPV